MIYGGFKLSRGISSDQYVEKGFLYLLLFSLVLHIAGFFIWYKWPKEQQKAPEATFIDLQDMQELKPQQQPRKEPEKAIASDRRQRVAKQKAPKGDMMLSRRSASKPETKTSRPAPRVSRPSPSAPKSPTTASAQQSTSQTKTAQAPQTSEPAESSSSELLRRSKPQPQAQSGQGGTGTSLHPALMPSATKMAKLEENYRRRFADDIAEGDTRFLNTNDVLFGSFLRRFETAIYGVWRYPREAMLKGEEGVTPVKIVFNRDGTINFSKTRVLDTSGSRALDAEVMRTLRAVGPMGNFPKDYKKEEFNLIAFFQYGNARSRLR